MSQIGVYRRNVFSQNGEDGVIAEIIRRLGFDCGWFCEFGAWDGRYGSNTYELLRRGWSGVMIEGDPARFNRLVRLAARYDGRLIALCRYVEEQGPSNLDTILSTTPIPSEFAVLSIDIDGADYQIWRSVINYRPAIVVIEIASRFPPGVLRVHGRGAEVYDQLLVDARSRGDEGLPTCLPHWQHGFCSRGPRRRHGFRPVPASILVL